MVVESISNFSESCGKSVMSGVFYFIHVLYMIYVSTRAVIRGGTSYFGSVLRLILNQIYEIGLNAIFLITILAAAIGGVVILNFSALPFLSKTEIITRLSVAIVVRELGPLLVALILIARSGTAMAAEIAGMKVNRELEALKVMAINPLAYVVFPRLVAGTLCALILTFYFNVIALLGGYLVARIFHDIHFRTYFYSLSDAIGLADVVLFYFKNGINGLAISSICCYQGLQVASSSHEVPIATTKAVLNSILSVAFCSFAATAIFYFDDILNMVSI